MAMGPVTYPDGGKTSSGESVRRVYYTGTATLIKGGVLAYATQATLAAFTKGPGVDVAISGGAVNELFAGIVADDSVGVTDPAWINIIVPRGGDVVWCAVAAATDAGDGILMAASQAFSDSGAYATGDLGVLLLDEDAADNPYAAENLAPVLFASGVT